MVTAGIHEDYQMNPKHPSEVTLVDYSSFDFEGARVFPAIPTTPPAGGSVSIAHYHGQWHLIKFMPPPGRVLGKALTEFAAQRWLHAFAQWTSPTQPGFSITKMGNFWIVQYDTEVAFIDDVLGMHYLAQLLERPHSRLKADDMVRRAAGTSAKPAAFEEQANLVTEPPAARVSRQETVSSEAMEKLRERKTELDTLIDEAREDGEEEEVEKLSDEYYEIEAELNRGKDKSVLAGGDDKEKARTAVWHGIERALKRLDKCNGMDKAARHLRDHIDRGLECSYRPPTDGPSWDISF